MMVVFDAWKSTGSVCRVPEWMVRVICAVAWRVGLAWDYAETEQGY